jgi:hypothetical protein
MNSIFVIAPYRHEGCWVFDDSEVGLHREPFVCGIDEMITRLVSDIPDAEKGFRLLFSPKPFPGYSVKLEWRRAEFEGKLVLLSAIPNGRLALPCPFQILRSNSTRALRQGRTEKFLKTPPYMPTTERS